MDRKSLHQTFDRLLDTIETLRAKCPWDAAQTPETIRTLSLEEADEPSQAILRGGPAGCKKE
ncbi:MAG: nucleoside triphosphate pyrophosphohydrolase, partial [Bacteroidales bacterium]|nr:nucleoside triphosphate pyrophosphohydrolase [Bacteroidales bacterium]